MLVRTFHDIRILRICKIGKIFATAQYPVRVIPAKEYGISAVFLKKSLEFSCTEEEVLSGKRMQKEPYKPLKHRLARLQKSLGRNIRNCS